MALTASRAKLQLPPNQQYESIARWILDKRLWTLSVFTGAGVVTSTTLLALFTPNAISFSFLVVVPVFGFLMCITSLLPLVLLRRWDLQPTHAPPASYTSQISALAHKPSTYRTLGMAAASFASYALLNCLCAASLGAHGWHLFAPTKRHALSLNENVLILMLGNALVGIALASKDLLINRAVVKWPSKISVRTHSVLRYATLSFRIGYPVLLALGVAAQFALGYLAFRKPVYRALMRLPLLGFFIKPFVIHSARPSTSLDIPNIAWRLLLLVTVTTIHYEHAQAFFDSIAGRGMLVARDSVDPDRCLRSGLEREGYFQHFAYLELAYIARKGPSQRRASVFTDPSNWHYISRTCLRLLGQQYAHLKRRGAPAPALAPATAPAPSSALTTSYSSHSPFGSSTYHSNNANLQTPRKQTQLVPSSAVYKPAPPPSPGAQLLKSLLSTSTVSPAAPVSSSSTGGSPPDGAAVGGAEAAKSLTMSGSGGAMPSVFVMRAPEEKTKRLTAPTPIPAPAPPPALAGGLLGPLYPLLSLLWRGLKFIVGLVTARVPSPPTRKDGEPFVVVPLMVRKIRYTLERERVERKVMGVLEGREMGRLCAQILAGFTVASLKEDAYGTLQQDIPRVLEALTKMLLALEEYTAELKMAAAIKGDAGGLMHKVTENEETETAIEQYINPYVNGLTENLRDIMLTFGDRLNVFRLPVPVARRLQLIVKDSN